MKLRAPLLLATLAFACVLQGQARAHSGHIIEGSLGFVAGDPDPERRLAGEAQRRVFEVTADDGHVISVDVSQMQVPEGGLRAIRGRRVRITAAPDVQSQLLGPGARFAARTLEIIDPPVVADQPRGNQKYLSLLCKFAGTPLEPRPPAYFTQQLGEDYPGFGHFFREASYNELTLTGSTAHSAWVTLPRSAAQYQAVSSDPNVYLRQMFDDCTKAANAAVDYSQYYGINLMFNARIDCCAWGGSMMATLDGVKKYWPLTWMPYYGEGITFGWRDHGILAHEMSHSFGSSHSEDPSGYQYGSSWDVVSNPGGTCAVTDASYGCLGQSQIAYNKTAMEILPLARIAHHAPAAAATPYVIERLTQPTGVPGAVLMVKAAIAGTTTEFYTIESRKRVGYDQNIPGDGVIIHRVKERLDNGAYSPQPAHLLSPLTGSSLGLGTQAIWPVGSVYRSAPDNIKITVVSFDSATGTAQVTVEPAGPSDYNFSVTSISFTEGAAAAVNIAVTRSLPYTGAGAVTWTTLDGSAVAGTDFGSSGSGAQRSGTLNWPAGTGGVRNITLGLPASNIPVIDDLAIEPTKSFGLSLSAPLNGVLGAQAAATVTIVDIDSVIEFQDPVAIVSEAGPNIAVALVRTGSTAGAQTIRYATAPASAQATADYVTTAGFITFTPGQVVRYIAVGPTLVGPPYVKVAQDTTIEDNEAFTITLSAPTNRAVLGPTQIATVTIKSDDNGVGMVATSRTFVEGTGAQQIQVKRQGSAGAVSVHYAFNNGSAINGVHYSGTGGMLNWADGDTSIKEIPVSILGAPDPNATRTFSVVLSAPAGAVLGSPTAAIAITDAAKSTLQFENPKYVVLENGGAAQLMVSRTNITGLDNPASVKYATLPGTAMASSDYITKAGTLNWDAGDGASKPITIDIVNNTVAETTEAFQVVLSAPSLGASLGTISTATVVILDDDEVFPAQGAMPPGFSASPGATRGWHVSADAGAYEGKVSLKSDAIEDGQSAGLDMTGTFTAGNVSFRVKVSSETTFDRLEFFIDDVPQSTTWSGTAVAGWQLSPAYPLPAGVHTLRWLYVKDASASAGMDAAYLDGLLTPAFTPAP